MLGRSTFGLSMWLLKWLPMSLVDRLLLIVSRLILGDTARYGLGRPSMGPLQLKNLSGKTPVLDVGTLAKIKKGDIKVHILVTSQFHHCYCFFPLCIPFFKQNLLDPIISFAIFPCFNHYILIVPSGIIGRVLVFHQYNIFLQFCPTRV